MTTLKLALLLGVPLTLATQLHAQSHVRADAPPPWCADTTDVAARFMRSKLTMMLTSSSSTSAAVRSSLGGLPQVSAGAIAFVTDEATCERASRALDSTFFEQPQTAAVLLMQVQDRYVVRPPPAATGATTFIVVTDSAFNRLGLAKW